MRRIETRFTFTEQMICYDNNIQGCEPSIQSTEGNTAGVDIARHTLTPRRRRPWHAQKPFAREPGDLHRRPRQSWPGRCRGGLAATSLPRPVQHDMRGGSNGLVSQRLSLSVPCVRADHTCSVLSTKLRIVVHTAVSRLRGWD
jgi:hypothetical protein